MILRVDEMFSLLNSTNRGTGSTKFGGKSDFCWFGTLGRMFSLLNSTLWGSELGVFGVFWRLDDGDIGKISMWKIG